MKLTSNPRNIKVNKIVVPESEKSIKKEVDAPKKSNPFGFAQSNPTQNKTNTTDKDSSSNSKVKQEKASPKKQSPKKNQPPPKAQPGKSSIASFFGSKPSTSNEKVDKSVSETASKIESVKIKDEPVEVTPNGTKSTQKRAHPNTSGKFVNKNGKFQYKNVI